MKEQIKQLEKQSRKLEPSKKKRNHFFEKAKDYSQSFLDDLPDLPAYQEDENMGDGVYDLPFEDSPKKLDAILDLLKSEVDRPGLNPASGKHAGYIPGGGVYPSAIADYLAAVTNRYAGVFFSSPGAVRIENMCIRWMCDLIGYPDSGSGNLTSGGSIANLIGLVVARDESGITASDFERAVIYTTRQVHHCVIKAIKFAGLREATVRTIPMDDHYCMKSDELNKQIIADKNDGLIPLTIFASAGTTDIGAVDPLNEIAEIAEQHDLWFHVDAAYGGFFLLTEHGQEVMRGIENSDSVTIDPHKGLFLPYGSGALLVKDGQKLYDSQHMTANYLQDTLKATEEASPADLSPELSKHFRGLRMWLPLQLFGIEPFRAALDEKLMLSRYFYQEVQNIDGIEVGPEPELSVMFFRYLPEEGDPNEFNKKLADAIHEDGRVFLSSTHINGTVYLRLAVLNFRTHLDDIELILNVLKEKIELLQ
ncbi:pyridoxal phosphate-dependent decarboxylase family protein [Fodinibius halophilus]|uniref:Aminotransferase class V-fold PLP-dependent enzyme n=1 Tax=Fodinibius halophilus TaxID=1736908 RepID=A0A6M1TFA8_9BACT|nr:aminotransferase class V-fold PLP-dependent enzyme [Fodinibius halophilus]NGP88842.1 aminotransferase class V-fold PLP-dependent enzyme [Fodinibius halophilus]